MTVLRMAPETARALGCSKRLAGTVSRIILSCIALNEGARAIIVHATDGSVWVWPFAPLASEAPR